MPARGCRQTLLQRTGRSTHQGIQVSNQQNCEGHVQHGTESICGSLYTVKEEHGKLSTMHSFGQGISHHGETMVRMGRVQVIVLLPPIDESASSDAADQRIVRQAIAK